MGNDNLRLRVLEETIGAICAVSHGPTVNEVKTRLEALRNEPIPGGVTPSESGAL